MSAFNTNTVILAATLTSGNKAVYEVREQLLNSRLYEGQSRNGAVISHGTLLAVKNGNDWFNHRAGRASWSERVTDPKAIALLESYPLAD